MRESNLKDIRKILIQITEIKRELLGLKRSGN